MTALAKAKSHRLLRNGRMSFMPDDGQGPEESLESALKAHEDAVSGLLKQAAAYARAVKAWQTACREGHLANRLKAADVAKELAPGLVEASNRVAADWGFDIKAYLQGEAWR